MLNEALFNVWVDKERRAAKAKKRRYPHFDSKIKFSNNISFFKSYFANSENVAKHSFYPFIRMEIDTPRFKKTDKKDEKGKPIRSMSSKKRPLAYAAHFDAYIYSFYSTMLTIKYEKKIKKWDIYDNVLAYLEKNLSNIEFAHEVFEYIKTKGECVALAFDVSSFFDGLDHEHLKRMWGKVINKYKLPTDHFKVFKSLTDYTYINKVEIEKIFPHLVAYRAKKIPIDKICEPIEFREKLRKRGLVKQNPFVNTVKESPRYGFKCGIPQGSPISACLSNIYMIEFDIRTKKEIDKLGGIYRRYCDDIIVVINTDDSKHARQFIIDEIKRYHLEINDSKTEVTYFRNNEKGELRAYDKENRYYNLQYLGFEFNGNNTYLRSSSMSRYYKRMSSRIRENLKAAYGNNSIGDKIFRKKLYNRYSDKGERNFISYAKRAAEYMESDTIKRQYKNNRKKVKTNFEKKKTNFEQKRKPEKLME